MDSLDSPGHAALSVVEDFRRRIVLEATHVRCVTSHKSPMELVSQKHCPLLCGARARGIEQWSACAYRLAGHSPQRMPSLVLLGAAGLRVSIRF